MKAQASRSDQRGAIHLGRVVGSGASGLAIAVRPNNSKRSDRRFNQYLTGPAPALAAGVDF
jgi:hypothetical protein